MHKLSDDYIRLVQEDTKPNRTNDDLWNAIVEAKYALVRKKCTLNKKIDAISAKIKAIEELQEHYLKTGKINV